MIPACLVAALLTSEVLVERDNTVIRGQGELRVRIAAEMLEDADNNGVVQITEDNLVLDFGRWRFSGAASATLPNAYRGIGIRVTGRNVTIRNAVVRGFRCGLYASRADGLTLEDCDFSDNYHQRLGSTTQAEDGADWLFPHHNDANEWLNNYASAVYIEDCKDVTVRRCRVTGGQNALCLDRVESSKVYDNDFSFNSGWGIALWRSSRNVITRNALDFCIRGYSHGVYNRGQDSAGLLMFEQNGENVIAENSATHGGDGLFGFAGREALGEDWLEAETERLRKEKNQQDVDALVVAPPAEIEKHRRRGCNDNLIINNDFSHAAAHGIEMTFSFGNRLIGNRLVDNAICGVWGGYSQDTLIAHNVIERNGAAGYGLERGGVNIEHGRNNRIIHNTFAGNVCAVHLWHDEDGRLALTPWARANGTASSGNLIAANRSSADQLVFHFRGAGDVTLGPNEIRDPGREIESEPAAQVTQSPDLTVPAVEQLQYPVFGDTRPVGARPKLSDRAYIIMTEWGPYDWKRPYLHFVGRVDGQHEYRVLGEGQIRSAEADGAVAIERLPAIRSPGLRVKALAPNTVVPYTLRVQMGEAQLERRATIINANWKLRFFAYGTDPRKDVDAWRGEAGSAVSCESAALDLRFAHRGPSQIEGLGAPVSAANLPADHFGTLAETQLHMPAGRWRVRTFSDDGVRVWVNERSVIENWTWHGPTEDVGEFVTDSAGDVRIRVEHFELDGYAVLTLDLEPIEVR